jgi:hypothetical protein
MPDHGTMAECDNCGVRGQYTVKADKKVLPAGWVTLPKTIVGMALFHDPNCRDAWTSSRIWRPPEETMALQELKQIAEAAPTGD